MSICIEAQKKDLDSKDDVDLASLLDQMEGDNGVPSSHHATQNSGSGDYELLVLHGSNESLASTDGDAPNGSKPNFFDKQFFKSLPMAILAKRRVFGSTSELSVPPVANAVHSLPGTPRLSHSRNSFNHKKPDRLSAKAPRNGVKPMLWNVWVSDLRASKEIALPRFSTCALLLHRLLSQLDYDTDLTQWSIIEQNSESLIERFIEDFEILDEVAPHHETSSQISRFCLHRTPGKYMILEKPEHCLPPDMLTYPPGSQQEEKVPDQEKRRQLQDILTKTAPEMCGWLHIREAGKKAWKKLYCILRNSGFYHSNKHTSKEQQHLISIAEIHTARIWFPINNKKQLNNSPTPHCFCLKSRTHDTVSRWFCAESSQLKNAWINGLRLTLNGNKFHESYFSAKNNDQSIFTRSRSSAARSVPKFDGNFVPMDFSGPRGRVINDPLEVAMVEMEHPTTSWKRRIKHRISNAGATLERSVLGSSAPSKSFSSISRSMHRTQPWFYGKITREAAADEIQRHGSLDGTFLVRESRTIPGSVVITVCYFQKSRHIPVAQIEKCGQLYYTCDNGETRFQDLIQLIDFHRLNKGSLPCPLLHECTSK